MDILKVIGVAFLGGLISILAGWSNAGGSFDWRKFLASLLRTIVSAAGFAAAFNYSVGVTPLSLLTAFLGTVSIDTLGNRLAGGAPKLIAHLKKGK